MIASKFRTLLAGGAIALSALALGNEPAVPDQKLLEKSLEPLMPNAVQVGRFQLFEARPHEVLPTPQIFRIDTVTGQVWAYSHASFGSPKQSFSGWLAVSEKEVFWFGQQLEAANSKQDPKPVAK